MQMNEHSVVCFARTDAGSGDVNFSGEVNVSDVVLVVNLIIGNGSEVDACTFATADVNGDGVVNVVDVVQIVDGVLGDDDDADEDK